MLLSNRHRLVQLALFVVAWLQCPQLCAQDASKGHVVDRVSGQILFDRGKERLIAGDYATACPLFEESHRAAPGIGVLLHLGLCLERSGKNADAWAAFQEAADRAHADTDLERERVARERAQQLLAKLAFLTIRVRRGASELGIESARVAGLAIRRNGASVSAAALGIEIPVDPGTHRVQVLLSSAPNAEREIELVTGQHATLELTLKEPSAVGPRPRSIISVKSSTLHDRNKPEPVSPSWRWAAWATAGVGATGLLVGAISGALAYSKMQDARSLCAGRETNDCPQESIRIQDEARAPARIATISAIAGAACLTAAGAYWVVSRVGPVEFGGMVGPTVSQLSLNTRW